MNLPTAPSTILICCSVFRDEVESLRQAHWPDAVIQYQNSMLHMRPQALAAHLDALVDRELARGDRIVLIYGDCCMAMTALEARPGVVRTRGNNCCELLLGREHYRRLSHEGAFFLFPEWTARWREIFTRHLGLTRANATSLMGDMHRKLFYLDTGVVPVPRNELDECTRYCGLPLEVLPVSLDPLRLAIEEAMLRLKTQGKPS